MIVKGVRLTELSTFIILLVKLKSKIKKHNPKLMSLYESTRIKINDCLKRTGKNLICSDLILDQEEYKFVKELLNSYLEEQQDKKNPLYAQLIGFQEKIYTNSTQKIKKCL